MTGQRASGHNHLYHPADPGELRAICARVFGPGTDIADCRPLQGGKFNTVYRIRLARPEREIVVRLAPVRTDLLYRFERVLMAAEAEACALLAAAGLPVPELILHDASREIVPREYLVCGFIPGTALSDCEADPEALDAVLRQLGAHCRRLHAIEGGHYGWFGPGYAGSSHEKWSGFLLDMIGEVAERNERFGFAPAPCIHRLRRAVECEPGLFRDGIRPALLHNDLHAGNVLVRTGARGPELAALLDVDRMLYGDPEFELGACGWAGAAFLRGYGRRGKEQGEGEGAGEIPGTGYRRTVYSLLKDLIDLDACRVQLGADRSARLLEASVKRLADRL